MFGFQVGSPRALTEERICSRTVPMFPNVIDPRDVWMGVVGEELVHVFAVSSTLCEHGPKLS